MMFFRNKETELKKKIERNAMKIEAHNYLLPTIGYSEGSARPAIFIEGRQYYYVIEERGTEISRNSTNDLKELLYWAFKDITFSLACRIELENRVPNQDFRRLLFEENLKIIEI